VFFKGLGRFGDAVSGRVFSAMVVANVLYEKGVFEIV